MTGTEASPEAPADRGPVKVGMISLGCPKNLVDSEMILGQVGAAGLEITARPEESDIVVINTCSFIDSAKEESINTVLEACEWKKAANGPSKVVVTGCLAQRYGNELRTEVPEVDAIFGLGQYDGIGEALLELLGEDRSLYRVADPDFACQAEVGRLRLTPSHYAYVRISEGCDNPCTFCAIPSIRGAFRSKSVDQILEEVRELVGCGAREIVIISQDTTSYGVDLDGRFQLAELLESIAQVPGLRWIRLLYVYPTGFSDRMIDAVASIPQVLPYVDIPLQHISDGMLRRMGRRMDEAATRRLLGKMRSRIPGLYLRTTFIVGFPGEDEREFETLLDFVREFRFERLGVFRYSPEESTPAYAMKNTVSAAVAEDRFDRLMSAQQEIAFEQNRERLGEETTVLIDSFEENAWVGRTHGEAPEIDPVVYLRDPRGAMQRSDGELGEGFTEISVNSLSHYQSLGVGRFVRARIRGSSAYDLIAEPLSEDSPQSYGKEA